MLHAKVHKESLSESVGYGLVAEVDIPAGTIVWVKTPLDLHLSEHDWRSLPQAVQERVEAYLYRDFSTGQRVLLWDDMRYMCHSCDPNVVTSLAQDVSFATRDISAGEQLTVDYIVTADSWTFDCQCGANECRGRVSTEDLRGPVAEAMQQKLESAIRRAGDVKQPLWEAMAPASRRRLDAAMADPSSIPKFRFGFELTQLTWR